MSKLLKIGLAVDAYKLDKFKELLKEHSYPITAEHFLTKDKKVKIVTFTAPPQDIEKLKKIFKKLEIDIKLSN